MSALKISILMTLVTVCGTCYDACPNPWRRLFAFGIVFFSMGIGVEIERRHPVLRRGREHSGI